MAIRILRTMLRQTAVYWGEVKDDGRGGHTAIQPVQIKCRWTDVVEEKETPTGDQHMSKAMVTVESLDGGVKEGADVEVGGFLKLTTLAGLGTALDLSQNEDALEIMSYRKTPTLKADEFIRTAML